MIKVKFDIDVSRAIKGINQIEKDLFAIDLAMEDWIQAFKSVALEIKPWQDRTGNLREQHKIEKIQDYEWQMSIDTTLGNPDKEEYGQVLEGSRKWAWIKPTLGYMTPYAEKMIVQRLNLIIKDF